MSSQTRVKGTTKSNKRKTVDRIPASRSWITIVQNMTWSSAADPALINHLLFLLVDKALHVLPFFRFFYCHMRMVVNIICTTLAMVITHSISDAGVPVKTRPSACRLLVPSTCPHVRDILGPSIQHLFQAQGSLRLWCAGERLMTDAFRTEQKWYSGSWCRKTPEIA